MKDLNSFVEGKKVKIIVDPSAASFIALLRENGYKVIKAKNNVIDGIRATQTAMNEGKIYFLVTVKIYLQNLHHIFGMKKRQIEAKTSL